jgi:hypothetical protein
MIGVETAPAKGIPIDEFTLDVKEGGEYGISVEITASVAVVPFIGLCFGRFFLKKMMSLLLL